MSLNELDAAAYHFINQTLNVPALDPVMVFITNYNLLLFLGVFLFIFMTEKLPSLVPLAIAVIAFGLADGSASMIKNEIQRVRPCNALNDVNLLVRCSKSFSMPSNHATNCFAVAMPFYVFTKSKIKHMILAIAVLVAFSRPYVGVHYPGDVTVGAIYGSLVGGTLAILCARALKGKVSNNLF